HHRALKPAIASSRINLACRATEEYREPLSCRTTVPVPADEGKCVRSPGRRRGRRNRFCRRRLYTLAACALVCPPRPTAIRPPRPLTIPTAVLARAEDGIA